ncbi:MAG TPA: 16S rRNA processing protein RimM, partial [Dehalococcoidia bacterium]|nr:16S rRNA processing protein RimM [Dehalococcoidia bacterium]
DQWITVPASEVPELPPGEFYHFQLLDLRVLTEEGEELGTVSDILETGSNDVYVVTGGSGEILIPALADVVKDIDLEKGVMLVSLPDGLR